MCISSISFLCMFLKNFFWFPLSLIINLWFQAGVSYLLQTKHPALRLFCWRIYYYLSFYHFGFTWNSLWRKFSQLCPCSCLLLSASSYTGNRGKIKTPHVHAYSAWNPAEASSSGTWVEPFPLSLNLFCFVEMIFHSKITTTTTTFSHFYSSVLNFLISKVVFYQ